MKTLNEITEELNSSCSWEWEETDGFCHYRFIEASEIKLYGAIEDDDKVFGTLFYENGEIYGEIEEDDAVKLVMAKSFLEKDIFELFASSVIKGAEAKRERNELRRRRARRNRARGISMEV